MNLLNEEIRVIQNSMTHIRKAIPLAVDSGEKVTLQNKYKELDKILHEKLEQCEDYKG